MTVNGSIAIVVAGVEAHAARSQNVGVGHAAVGVAEQFIFLSGSAIQPWRHGELSDE